MNHGMEKVVNVTVPKVVVKNTHCPGELTYHESTLDRMLPKLYSTVEEMISDNLHSHSHLSSRSCDSDSNVNGVIITDVAARKLQDDIDEDPPHEGRRISSSSRANQHQSSASSLVAVVVPHLFLHFDINETILVGDVAGNDTFEDCLNKIIAKVAFVSTNEYISSGRDNTEGDDDNGNTTTNFTNFEPKRWWDGSELHYCNPTSTTTNNNNNITNKGNLLGNTSTDTAATTATNPSPPSIPAPLYTGWTIPHNTCSYYKTKYKRHAREFTLYHPQYRSIYELLLDGVHEEKKGADNGAGVDDVSSMFQHLIPAFFHTLMYYFPSATTTATASSMDSTGINIDTNKNSNKNNNAHNNNNNKSVIDYDSIIRLPRPPKTTLVLRTFGTDLHRILRAISEFARGNHPHFPEYTNPDLIFKEEEDTPFCGGWRRSHGGGKESDELVYELHPMMIESPSCPQQHVVCYSGDDEILTYLQSKTIVGIEDDYPFWDEHDCAPWAGKPVWARKRPGVVSGNDDRSSQYNHHHILLDDNIHNDPNDGAGAVRVPMLDGVDKTATKYTSLHGNEALKMHGRHLIRVPTVRPIIEPDWFIRQIEDARWRIFVEEEGMNDDEIHCFEKNSIKKDEESRTDCIIANHSLDLSDRDLSDDELNQILTQQLANQALERMNLSRNRLKCLPVAICSYSKVIHLDISRNSLHSLPSEIGNLMNLVELFALSNQLRMRQLPLVALASLRHLKVLDLRYNRKLKTSALITLREALVQDDESQLEIRCTTVDLDFDETLEFSAMQLTKSDATKKLSACDRDATLLRSQLEPLSTPQLSKRLEQTFDVSLSDGVTTQDRYDREFVMTKILDCYEKHGPRRVVHVEGNLVPSSEHLASLLTELEALPWPKTTRERPKIRAENYMILQKPGVGKPDSARTRKETAKLDKYRSLFELAVDTLAEIDRDFAHRFTALAVTKNFVGSPHIDTLNVGPFYGLSLGEFTGGGCIAVEYSALVVAEVNTKGRFGKVDGRFPHWVTPYEGTRYSLIYYVTSGDVEPQTTAIFPPLSDNVLP